jgi:gamma-glutamyltranspeptidase/glutathione hydrolase
LRSGGNAVDAVVATNLALAVAYPHMCGVGGDLLAMVWHDGTLHGLNSSGALPLAAPSSIAEVPERGPLSVTVPGAPAAWRALVERWGTRSLAELARPAIALARRGVERSPGLVRSTANALEVLDDEARSIYVGEGMLVQPDLARTLEALDDFYVGEVAWRAPAPFLPADFLDHSVEWVEPLRREFFDVTVCEMPPNSRGHLVLEFLERVGSLRGLTPDDAAWHETLIRAALPAEGTGDTVYICAADDHGQFVSLNQSLFMAFGSGVVVPGTGVLLHNRGAYHTPASYRGGAKPVHTLAPGMCLRSGSPLLLFGTMGGEAQVQIHLQLLARLLVAGEELGSALSAPRWVLKRDELRVEPGLPDLTASVPGLSVIPTSAPDEAGHAHALLIGNGYFEAAVDPRSDGKPVGW